MKSIKKSLKNGCVHLLFFKYLKVDRICALRVWAGGPQTSGLPLADVQMVSIFEAIRGAIWVRTDNPKRCIVGLSRVAVEYLVVQRVPAPISF